MTATALSPNGVHGAYVYVRHWRWVSYPVADVADQLPAGTDADGEPAPLVTFPHPDYAGFRAHILGNPTGGEVRAEQQMWKAYTDPADPTTEEEYLAAVAYRVRAWNAQAGDEDGAQTPIPAPGETDDPDAWQAFYAIPSDLLSWLVLEMRTAHVPKRVRATTPSAPVGTTATPIPSLTDPAPVPRPS